MVLPGGLSVPFRAFAGRAQFQTPQNIPHERSPDCAANKPQQTSQMTRTVHTLSFEIAFVHVRVRVRDWLDECKVKRTL